MEKNPQFSRDAESTKDPIKTMRITLDNSAKTGKVRVTIIAEGFKRQRRENIKSCNSMAEALAEVAQICNLGAAMHNHQATVEAAQVVAGETLADKFPPAF